MFKLYPPPAWPSRCYFSDTYLHCSTVIASMVIFTVHKNTIHSMNYWRSLEWILAFRSSNGDWLYSVMVTGCIQQWWLTVSSNGDWLYHINYIVCTLIYSNKGTYLVYMYIKIKSCKYYCLENNCWWKLIITKLVVRSPPW